MTTLERAGGFVTVARSSDVEPGTVRVLIFIGQSSLTRMSSPSTTVS